MTPIPYPHFTTLEELLKNYESPLELAIQIDRAMLLQVLYLHHEPGSVKMMIPIYESLWEVRNLILNQIQSSNP